MDISSLLGLPSNSLDTGASSNLPATPSQVEARTKIALAMLGRRPAPYAKNLGEGLQSFGSSLATAAMLRQANQLADRAAAAERTQAGSIPPRTAAAAPPGAPGAPAAPATPAAAAPRPTPVRPVRVPGVPTNTIPGAIPPTAAPGSLTEGEPQDRETDTADTADIPDTARLASYTDSEGRDSLAALLAGQTSFPDASESAGTSMPMAPAATDAGGDAAAEGGGGPGEAPSLEGLSGGFLAAPTRTGGGAVAGNMGRLRGVNPQLVEVVQAGARTLPEGYTVQPTSGYRAGDRGYHGSGRASDWQIYDPDGNAIPNTGDDPTGLYRQLARGASAYAAENYPNMPLAWGGAFDKRKGGGTGIPDLMHFDLGGDRGNLRPDYRLAALNRTAAGNPPTMTDIQPAPEGAVRMAQALSPSLFSPAPMNPQVAPRQAQVPQEPSQPGRVGASDLNLPPEYNMPKPVPPPIPQERPMTPREIQAWNLLQSPNTFPAVKETAKSVLLEEQTARNHLYQRDVEAYKAGVQDYNAKSTLWEKQQSERRQKALDEAKALQAYNIERMKLPTEPPATAPATAPGARPAGLPGQPPPDSPEWTSGLQPAVPRAPPGMPQDKYQENIVDPANKKFKMAQEAIPHFAPVLELIDEIRNDPNLSAGVGFPGHFIGQLPLGTAAHDFQQKNRRLTGEAFMRAYTALRGTGAIATKEGQEAKEAIATLMTSQSPEAYRKNLLNFEGLVRRELAQAQLDARVPVTAWHIHDSDPQFAPNPGTRSGGRVYMGIGDPADLERSWRPY